MDTAIPKPEYPRPDRDRSARWLPLNGTWSLQTDSGEQPIVVPYAWETIASGVRRTWLEHATYRREMRLPRGWGSQRAFLCFGAVHHEALVRVDDVVVGTHVGGYTSFEFDVTDLIRDGESHRLTVEVSAPADKRDIVHGKQRSIPRDDYDGVSFTPSSGIWQSVWLEARGRTWVESVTVGGDDLTGFDVALQLAGDAPADQAVTLEIPGIENLLRITTDAGGRAGGRLDIREPRLWSPADPHLYAVEITVADDHLVVPAGLRSIRTAGDRLLLNGEPFYVRGVLDQGYWPESGITAPDDAALVRDLELARDSGYNLVRKHLKLEEARFYHHADRLGVLVWAEPASTSRFSAVAAAAFEAQIPDMVARDGNHPSIIIWGLYNEEWGLDWDVADGNPQARAVQHARALLRALDRSRPVVDNSGWSHIDTDLLDWHYYAEHPADWIAVLAGIAEGSRAGFPVRLGPNLLVERLLNADGSPAATARPNLNSEYGGGFTSLERAWHLRWQTQELRRHPEISGYVYTELTDVEHESAGLFDADRRPKDLGGFDPRDANADTVLIPEMVPAQAGTDLETPTEPWTLRVRLSHHRDSALVGRVHAAWSPVGTPWGATAPVVEISAPASVPARTISDELTLRVPRCPAPAGRLLIWCTDAEGDVVARTHIDAGPLEHGRRMTSTHEPLVEAAATVAT